MKVRRERKKTGGAGDTERTRWKVTTGLDSGAVDSAQPTLTSTLSTTKYLLTLVFSYLAATSLPVPTYLPHLGWVLSFQQPVPLISKHDLKVYQSCLWLFIIIYIPCCFCVSSFVVVSQVWGREIFWGQTVSIKWATLIN